MAWNPSPEVAVARDAAKRLGADRVVIYFTTGDKFGYSSYGATKVKCDEAKRLAERTWEQFESELSQLWF